MKVTFPTSSNVCFGNVICPLKLWAIIFLRSFVFPARKYISDASVVYIDLVDRNTYLFCSASGISRVPLAIV